MTEQYKQDLCVRAAAISVYQNLKSDAAFCALMRLYQAENPIDAAQAAADYFGALAQKGFTHAARAYFLSAALHDENAFSKTAAKGEPVPPQVLQAAQTELETLRLLSKAEPNDFALLNAHEEYIPHWTAGEADFSIQTVLKNYLTHGYGVFADSVAYTYHPQTKTITAAEGINPIQLDDLKNYEDEKAAVVDNTVSFLQHLPSNNVLLYGDRGTGKSSAVHALLNAYSAQGLRLLEVGKAAIADFPKIIARLRDFSMRFIIFLDDLTFIEGADDFAELKAALEGGVTRAENVLIYATTNRRHLLKESFSSVSGDDMHAADTVEEQMSLSDRFGLVVTYLNPDKREFLSILQQILHDRGLVVAQDTLSLLAERYALKKGGRSPRAARQLADRIESRLKRNLPLDE